MNVLKNNAVITIDRRVRMPLNVAMNLAIDFDILISVDLPTGNAFGRSVEGALQTLTSRELFKPKRDRVDDQQFSPEQFATEH